MASLYRCRVLVPVLMQVQMQVQMQMLFVLVLHRCCHNPHPPILAKCPAPSKAYLRTDFHMLQDTAILMQTGWPDMRLPILYALSHPSRARDSDPPAGLSLRLAFKPTSVLSRPSATSEVVGDDEAGKM